METYTRTSFAAVVLILFLSACSSVQSPADVMVTLNAGVGEGEVDNTNTPEPTPTNTPIPPATPTPTATPWVWATPLYNPDETWPYGLPEMVEPIEGAWSDDVKVYVLLGSDYASWRANLATGTDNTDAFIILIVRSDPALISMVSVPRDLYVFQPGFGMQRINTAYRNGGSEMVADTLRYNFGLPMDGYAYVRMEAFSRFIDDALHGINVEVRSGVIDHCSEIWFNMLPGTHFMDGPAATCYARIRKYDGGFNRQSRQVEVLLAMKEKFFEIAGDEPFELFSNILEIYMTENRYTDVSILDVMETFPVALEANENGQVNEYQINYDVGIEHFNHPTSGAWLLTPPHPDCVSDLMWKAVMGEPWENLVEACAIE